MNQEAIEKAATEIVEKYYSIVEDIDPGGHEVYYQPAAKSCALNEVESLIKENEKRFEEVAAIDHPAANRLADAISERISDLNKIKEAIQKM